jgi:hypothetical protein
MKNETKPQSQNTIGTNKLNPYIEKVADTISPILDIGVEFLLIIVISFLAKKVASLKVNMILFQNKIMFTNPVFKSKLINAILNQLLGYTEAERIIYIVNSDKNQYCIYEQAVDGHKIIASEYRQIVKTHLNNYLNYLKSINSNFEKYDFEDSVSFQNVLNDQLALVYNQLNYAVIKSICIFVKPSNLIEFHYCTNTKSQAERFNSLNIEDHLLEKYLYKLRNI